MAPSNALRRAFSLLELPQVVAVTVFLGVTFVVPQFLLYQETGKIRKAYSFLSDVQRAQSRYQAEHGFYAREFHELDLHQVSPAYYCVDPMVCDGEKWSITLHRFKGEQTRFGNYTIHFDANGLNDSRSTVPSSLRP